jgi:hypothetical protein
MSIKVLLDNSAANLIAQLDETAASPSEKKEDRDYLKQIILLEKRGVISIYHNPWSWHEGAKTPNDIKRESILKEYQRRYKTVYHSTTFPFLLSDKDPVTFISEEQSKIINDILSGLPQKFKKDINTIANALFDPEIKFHFILTCDRKHLANTKLQKKITAKGFSLKICTPKQLFMELSNKYVS